MRNLALASTAALAATVLAPITASAAPGTCAGQPVTMMAGPGESVDGTDGDDVIVVDRARRVDALDGNDRVCVTWLRGQQRVTIDAGDGDDRVLVLSDNRRATVYALLGSGGDVFRGGPADETVTGSSIVRASLGAGDDSISVTERKYLPADAPQQAAPYVGGPGRDRLVAGVAQDDLTVDERIVGDLRRGTVAATNDSDTDVVRMRRFEDLRLYGDVVTVRGDGGPNSLQAYGCTVRIVGRAGADVLAQPQRFENFNGCRRGMTMRGGRGADVLRGRAGPDRLIGGAGHDRAVGNDGRDLCRAEVRRNCERR